MASRYWRPPIHNHGGIPNNRIANTKGGNRLRQLLDELHKNKKIDIDLKGLSPTNNTGIQYGVKLITYGRSQCPRKPRIGRALLRTSRDSRSILLKSMTVMLCRRRA